MNVVQGLLEAWAVRYSKKDVGPYSSNQNLSAQVNS